MSNYVLGTYWEHMVRCHGNRPIAMTTNHMFPICSLCNISVPPTRLSVLAGSNPGHNTPSAQVSVGSRQHRLTMELPLPDELIGSIVDHLDVPSLLRCMQVCKLFYSIISESAHLIYKIELFASHMEDNEYSSMETVNRLNLLREYNRKWNDLEWTSSGSIPMTNGCWELSGGILAQVIHRNTLSLVQLPCKLKDIPERRWSVPFDFRICDFTLDNSQDLVVLLELVGTFPPNVSCNIHLRTLSGEQHPRAAETQITYTSTSLHATLSFMIQICGNRVAVLFYDQLFFELDTLSTNPFLVWNWQTGQQELVICSHSRDYILRLHDRGSDLATIIRSDSGPALQILRASAQVDPILPLEETPCVCELQLPRVQGDVEWLLVRSEPTPTWKPPTGSGVPFYASRKDYIFSVSIRAIVDEMDGNAVLFIPLSTLLLEVERSHDVPRRNVPWDAWGPDRTRIISMQPSETWICYTYGMKFIQHVPWNNGYAAQVYDFNPYAARKHVKTTVDSLLPWKHLAEESKPAGWCEGFCSSEQEQVVTRLPGRVATIALAHSNNSQDAAMIGEDNIVIVQVAYLKL
ncbi:hypothetical protein JVT61DRAFT_6524 [Boletus reticuloceps]|uniref:F-box domain-containing protein n=1 Tax=Boletus reticuloceps TaxID=495285 RepID=A0A8I2YK33_9AGAM|nr:hypothetical protein JVT61DRAFT_6524 [Boletus reticuloceps]